MATARIDSVILHLRRAMLRQDEADRTDGQLLASFIDQKDEAAFEALVRRHGPMVLSVCRRVVPNHHDAEDAFQAAFLVLARKASSVRPRERLAGWLHGVALRTAMKARTTTAKRRGREKQVTEMPEPEAARQNQECDLQPLLDQELKGLPEYYRLPILLCDLEGRTIRDAARQLGWPQGTLAGRLSRGRKLLASRLANRGVVLSAGLLATVFSQNAVSAAVPAALMRSTIRAATTIAAGHSMVAGVVPARVAILTEGVLKAMLLSKLKTVTVGALLVALLLGAAGAIYETRAANPPRKDRKTTTLTDGSTDKGGREKAAKYQVPPPSRAAKQEYVIRTRLLEAGADWPRELLCPPKVTVDDGQLIPIHMPDGAEILLEKVGLRETIRIGTFLDVRVTRLEKNRVRLFCRVHRNEVEKSGHNELCVLGNNVAATQDVELHRPVKIVLQKNASGSAQRWVEITVDEQIYRH